MPPMPANLCRFCGQPIAYLDRGPTFGFTADTRRAAVRGWVHTGVSEIEGVPIADWALCSGPSAPEPVRLPATPQLEVVHSGPGSAA